MLAFFLPESPTWLVRKERKAAALKAQSRLDESAEDTGANVNELQQSIELEEKQRRTRAATYNSCFKGTDARRTMIVVFANVLPQLFGLTLLGQATYFMQVVGMSHHNSALFLIIGIALGLLANLISIWAVSVTGRRSLMLWSLAGAGVLWLGMGITGCFGNDIVTWYTAVTMIIIITVCGVGVWPVSYVVGGETSSLHLRGKTQGIGWLAQGLSNAVFGAVLPYIFSADQGDLKAKTGFVYAGLCAVAVLITWAAVPEMRGRSAMEIDKMFSEGVPARRFRSWPDDADLGTPDLV
ncbi:hypothetical protein H2203_006853 [Taxawa tesnikishii (nom. ined.)]|nr:hypothetical protein H2203_006853 [Dothideales sp. JES 119]